MLDVPLRRSLNALIVVNVGWPIDLGLVSLLLGHDALRRQPSVQNAYQCAEWIVREALAAPDPVVLIQIVRTLDPPGSAVELHQLADGLEADPAKWTGEAAQALFIPANWPFVDRQDIRSLLGQIATGAGPPAITVEAPAGHGKRTTGDYIEHLARATQSFHPVVVELRRQPHAGAMGLLADNIRHGLGLAPDSGTTHEEPQRQAEVLASNIALGAYKARKPVWFVPIVVDTSGLEEGILPFIDDLLKLLAETPTLSEHLRMVVMADSVNELGLENLPPPAARVVLPEVTSEKVGEWFEAAAPGKEKALYTLAAREVLHWVDNRNPQPELRLRWLSRQCEVVRTELVA